MCSRITVNRLSEIQKDSSLITLTNSGILSSVLSHPDFSPRSKLYPTSSHDWQTSWRRVADTSQTSNSMNALDWRCNHEVASKQCPVTGPVTISHSVSRLYFKLTISIRHSRFPQSSCFIRIFAKSFSNC